MKLLRVESMHEEKGFTLVELAVVMVIIGLLIGGILKGQEMIANQKINSTITQIKALDAATSTFIDMYDAFPGDMADAQDRLSGCTANCDEGDGDGLLNDPPTALAGDESYHFGRHLAAADLVGGVAVEAADEDAVVETELNGRYLLPGYTAGGADGLNAEAKGGHYFIISTDETATAGDALTGLEAARIDRKLDDGQATTGAVFGEDAACESGALADQYEEVDGTRQCDIWIRFNG